MKVPDQRLVDRVIGALAIRRGDKVLDVGSGTGFMIKFLLDADPEVVYACDLSQRCWASLLKNTRMNLDCS